jgi:predicted O-linked N-acetylglucosamine transferase (SPINDLY family)
MDYIVADDFIIPAGHESHFAEQVLRLPNTYLPYDRTRNAVPAVSRAEYGLPEDATVLVCLGQVRKINPPLFDIWMDVLNRLPKTVLWLAHTHRPAMQNLRREAQKRGVAPERLIFAVPVSDNAEHLARYRAADLALDTFPYGSHSTAADSLWMGCPLIALVGETFAARVSGSILRTAGAEELITYTPEDYRSLILQVAQDDGRRLELRARLEAQRLTCPLFDIERFTRSLERAYLEMAAAKSS